MVCEALCMVGKTVLKEAWLDLTDINSVCLEEYEPAVTLVGKVADEHAPVSRFKHAGEWGWAHAGDRGRAHAREQGRICTGERGH